MKAALFYAPHSPMRIEAIDIAEPVGREVLVETVASGVCHSDLHSIDRGTAPPPQPVVLGHEAAGIVAAVGPHVTEFQPGTTSSRASRSSAASATTVSSAGRTSAPTSRTAGRTRRPG